MGTQINKDLLWKDYSKNPTDFLREKIIIEYVTLVKLVAGRLSVYLGHCVEYEDLVSYGIFGLIDAIDKFDYYKGIKFETYASLRIRGSILDQIRKMDWIPRSVRQKQKSIDAAITKIEVETHEHASDDAIAKELGISLEEYYSWQGQANVSNISSLEDFIEQGNEIKAFDSSRYSLNEPEVIANQNETKELLAKSLEILTEKEKMVILLYYYEELTLKEISQVMEVSESRSSQLHSKALKKMKEYLGDTFKYFMG